MRTRLFILWLGCLVLALPGSAQDQAEEQAPAPGAEAAEAPGPGETGEAGGESGEAGGEPGGAAGDAGAGAENADADEEEVDEEFIFSEEIPAETQLTFPVDI